MNRPDDTCQADPMAFRGVGSGRRSRDRLVPVKILHTADWHAGRSLHGVDRTPEVRAALQELSELAMVRDVDLILVAGDLFDNKNPSADAAAAVYEFFVSIGQRGIPSVVIAGNHDSPGRLDAVRSMLELAQVHTVGWPRVASKGGTFDLARGGEVARIAALPFVSERRLVKLKDLMAQDAGQHRETYQSAMRKLVLNLSQGFGPDTINLLLLHTTMEGATLANSEYVFHSTETYTLKADVLPEQANYIALGHIHKPQTIRGVADHQARYAGSLLQLDFGEQGDAKGVVILEARAGRPTEILEQAPIRAGRPLRRVRLDADQLDGRTSELADFQGWLKLVVTLDAPRPGLKDRIRKALANVLSVEVEVPTADEEMHGGVDLERVSLTEAFTTYYLDDLGRALPDGLKVAFEELHEHVVEGEDR